MSTWKVISHSYQIADTGDYDGCYELTNGKISFFTKDDDDEALQEIVKVLDSYNINFYLDDSHLWEILSLKQDADYWKQKYEEMKERCEAAESLLQVMVVPKNYASRSENDQFALFMQRNDKWQSLKQKQL